MGKIKVRLILILLTLFQITGIYQLSCSQTISKGDSISIMTVLHNQEIKWNEGNLKGYMEGYLKSDSLKFITKKGVTYGWDNTILKYQKSYPDKAAMGTLQFEVISIEALCDRKALMTGKWTLLINSQNNSTKEIIGYFTLIWQNIDGKWYIIVDHTS
jgi:hypothetical protein